MSRSYENARGHGRLRGAAPSGSIDEAGVALETEPNGTPADANPLELGRRTKGMIDPLGEEDYFTLAIPGYRRRGADP